jgi:hypothetical protein
MWAKIQGKRRRSVFFMTEERMDKHYSKPIGRSSFEQASVYTAVQYRYARECFYK